MKSLRIFSLAAVMLAFATVSFAQTKTETFKVSGNCGMCKTKIEKAAKTAGATEATWDADKQEVTVTYSSSETNTAKIQQKIADVGYDNAGFTATAESYKKLPGCCKYERSASETKEAKMECCKGGKCTKEGHDGKDCCKEGKCTKEGHEGKGCCKKDGDKMDCCKDGKCTKEGHDGKDCCKKEDEHKGHKH